MTLTAAELRRRARADMREAARRREIVAITAVNARVAAVRARDDAHKAAAVAAEALAAAAVTLGGPEKASTLTGIPANDFRAARREVPACKAIEIADDLVAAAVRQANRRGAKSAPPQDHAPRTAAAPTVPLVGSSCVQAPPRAVSPPVAEYI